MNVLELFSGTKSVGKCCDSLGWNSISVDLLLDADFKCDIMDFDYKQFDKDYFDIIWASPPCTEYSRLQECFMGRLRKGQIYTREIQENNMKESDKLVNKALEIIDYFNCKLWFMENPQTGRLKERDIMKDIPYYDVDYCMYSDWGYKKRTRIWTNKKDWVNKLCDKKCGNMIDGKHKARMGTSKTILDGDKLIRVNTAFLRNKYKDYENLNNSLNKDTTQKDRYRIPEDLIYDLFLN
jgi:site-specific DNA-cytosine methylase